MPRGSGAGLWRHGAAARRLFRRSGKNGSGSRGDKGVERAVSHHHGRGPDTADVQQFRDPRDKDRQSVVSGKSVSVRVGLGGRHILTKKNNQLYKYYTRTSKPTRNVYINENSHLTITK